MYKLIREAADSFEHKIYSMYIEHICEFCFCFVKQVCLGK